MLVAQLLVSLSSVITKQLDPDMPIFQLLFYRQGFSTLMLIPLLFLILNKPKISQFQILHFSRSLLIVVGNMAFLIALQHLPLVTVTAVFYLAPMLLVICSAFFLAERVTKQRLATVAIGFVGILIIARPSQSNTYIMFAFLCAITVALNTVLVKRIANKEQVLVSVFTSNIYTMLILVPLVYWENKPITNNILIAGFWLGLLYIGITYLIIIALRRADASSLAPADYFGLVFAAILGDIYFDDPISLWMSIGIIVVLFSIVIPMFLANKVEVESNSHEPYDH